MRKCLTTIIACMLIIMPITILHAYYHEKPEGMRENDTPKRIILKLKNEIAVSPLTDRGIIKSLGLPALDEIQDKFAITGQEYLFKANIRKHLPDDFKNVFVIEVPADKDIFEIIAEYERQNAVQYVHPDWQLELYDSPNDPLYGQQWSLNNTGQGFYHVERYDGCGNDVLIIQYGIADADIDADEVFADPPDNTRTVIVAIVDTGVDMDHPDLAGRIWSNPREIPENGLDDDNNGYIDDINGWDFSGDADYLPSTPDNDPTDTYGHGTHCSGIVTAVTGNGEGIAGIAEDCYIMALKFYPIMLASYATQAIIYAADNGADVISMSWGYPWPIPILEDALEYARAKGVILCAAAGNDEAEVHNYPASYPSVITVGATNYLDEVTFFSTYGDFLDVSAPGRSVLSLRGDSTDMYGPCEPNVHIIDDIYYLASGTSMACPHVAGEAALLCCVAPGLTPDAAQDIIQNTADDILDPYGDGSNYPGWDKYSGYGRINLYNALSAAPGLRAKIEFPVPNYILSGVIEITGLADGADFVNYVLEYGSGANPSVWSEITTSSIPVTDGTLGIWDAGALNGQYTIRLRVGETNMSMVSVHIINSTAAQITSPAPDDTLTNWTEIVGTAICPDFMYYRLEYGAGSSPSSWNEISETSIPVVNGKLGGWYLGDLEMGYYTIRLSLFSDSGLEGSDSVLIYTIPAFAGENGWKINIGELVSNMVNYGDLDNDGQNEIIVGTPSGVRFFNPDGSEKTTGIPTIPAYSFVVPFAIGNLDNDGIDDLVLIGLIGHEARLLGFPSGDQSFEINLPFQIDPDVLAADPVYNYPYVALKDMDSDGRDDIYCFAPFECYVYYPDGSYRAQMPTPPEYYQSQYLSADIDGDGTDEFYSAIGKVYQSNIIGVVLDSFELIPLTQYGYYVRNLSAVDIDDDNKYELIVHAQDRGSSGTHLIWAFDENLALKPGWPHDTEISTFLIPPEPIFADIDMDGSLEYFMLFYELVGALAYAWHIDGTPYLGDSNSAIFATAPNPGKMYTGVLGDFDGDQYPDLVACATYDVFLTYMAERLVAWDRYGIMLDGWPLITKPADDSVKNWGVHFPAIGDIDKDGNIDLIMTTCANVLIFNNFEGVPYNASAAQMPFWRYNRSINKVAPIHIPLCGDATYDNTVNVSDAVHIINYVFAGGAPPYPYESGDANCDDNVNISDAVWIINYIFAGGYNPCDIDGDGIPDC